nr:uncharacterized protein LOC129278311 [Lytechinus pictus]
MYANALTFPLAVAIFLVGLAILPGMLADDGMDITNDEQPIDALDARNQQIDLQYLLSNYLANRDTRSWSPLRNTNRCIGEKCRYAWKRGFETPVGSSRINSRGAPAWATSQFSNSGCSGSSCLTGWKRGFRVLPQLEDDEN